MHHTILGRLSAPCGMLGGLALVPLTATLFLLEPPITGTPATTGLLPVPLVLVMIGLAGAHERQRTSPTYGPLGRAGFLTSATGIGMVALGFALSSLWILIVLGALIVPWGLAMFGLGTIRSSRLPAWSGALPLAAGLIGLTGLVVHWLEAGETASAIDPGFLMTFVALGTAWTIFGYVVWRSVPLDWKTASQAPVLAAQ